MNSENVFMEIIFDISSRWHRDNHSTSLGIFIDYIYNTHFTARCQMPSRNVCVEDYYEFTPQNSAHVRIESYCCVWAFSPAQSPYGYDERICSILIYLDIMRIHKTMSSLFYTPSNSLSSSHSRSERGLRASDELRRRDGLNGLQKCWIICCV